MGKKKPTIIDIAKRANVSKSTVARVLSGQGGVKEAKRDAVLAVIQELNFQPNALAQALAAGQSLTVGVLTQDITSPFFSSISRGIQEGISGSGYAVLFAESNWGDITEYQIVEQMVRRRVDGLIAVEGHLPEKILVEIGEETPLIVVGRRLPELIDNCIWMDQQVGAYLATKYLIELGHRQIAHITGALDQHNAVERRDGYLQALMEKGIEPNDELIIQGDFLEPSGTEAVETLLERQVEFTAIFAANDPMASGARLALYRRGIPVPEEISLVGFDDQRISAFMTPPLTTVRQPILEMGHMAARAILNLIHDRPMDVPELKPELIIRESVLRLRPANRPMYYQGTG